MSARPDQPEFTDPLQSLPDGPLALSSRAMLAMLHLPSFLMGRKLVPLAQARESVAIVGWGDKAPARRGQRVAARLNKPFLRIEDGFMRSVGLGKSGAPPVGVVIDAHGVYFDAHVPSDLERLIATCTGLTRELEEQAIKGLELWRTSELSKYNLPQDFARHGDMQIARHYAVILADQVHGDASIAGAGASVDDFARMLDQALLEFGADNIALRMHPDVRAGKARGYLASLEKARHLTWVDPDLSPAQILKHAGAVWTVSSQLGFEALIAGVDVSTFAMPFYAGWGLTADHACGEIAERARARRRRDVTLPEMFAYAVLIYTRYADPVTKQPVSFEHAAARIIDWRNRLAERQGRKMVCFNFPRWKRRICDVFLGGPGTSLTLTSHARPAQVAALAKRANMLGVWGAPADQKFLAACAATGLPLHRIEDGFLRSVGLGSDLRMPGSIVIDDMGMYYDAMQPSRLEYILQSQDIAPTDIERAQQLRARLIELGLTKYNLSAPVPDLRAQGAGRKVLLVAGQVPGDAAIRLGAGHVKSNEALLQSVRHEHPDAFIVYKEHPDLVAGNRRGRARRKEIETLADRVITQGDIASLFPQCDGLHVISSLAGFEALMRGVPVTVWGAPFYAGWGLSEDRMSLPRRGRSRTLDEMVAAALILYPQYADPLTGVPCSVEDFVESLADQLRRPRRPGPQGMVLQLTRFSRWLTGQIATGP